MSVRGIEREVWKKEGFLSTTSSRKKKVTENAEGQ